MFQMRTINTIYINKLTPHCCHISMFTVRHVRGHLSFSLVFYWMMINFCTLLSDLLAYIVDLAQFHNEYADYTLNMLYVYQYALEELSSFFSMS